MRKRRSRAYNARRHRPRTLLRVLERRGLVVLHDVVSNPYGTVTKHPVAGPRASMAARASMGSVSPVLDGAAAEAVRAASMVSIAPIDGVDGTGADREDPR